MDQVPSHKRLSHRDRAPDRRRRDPVGRARRTLIGIVRSRWVAMFAIAFAVSWSFHQVDEVQEKRLKRSQAVLECTISGVAEKQRKDGLRRVDVGAILEACEKHGGK